jgi:hypothetical protein
MPNVSWTAFMQAIRRTGFVIVAQSQAVVVLGRASRSVTLDRVPQLNEATLDRILRTMGIGRETFRGCLEQTRPPIRRETPRTPRRFDAADG